MSDRPIDITDLHKGDYIQIMNPNGSLSQVVEFDGYRQNKLVIKAIDSDRKVLLPRTWRYFHASHNGWCYNPIYYVEILPYFMLH